MAANQSDDRDAVRTFWLKEIQELRDRHDRERLLTRNLQPIQNREIAERTGIPRSTLSDLLTSKHNMVPEWEKVSLIIDSLGGTSKEWVPKWQAARAAYDRLNKRTPDAPNSPAPAAESPTPVMESPAPVTPKPSGTRTWLIVSAAAVLVAALGIGVWLLIPDGAPAGPRPATGVANARCLRVTDGTRNVSVLKNPFGTDRWTEWPGNTRFWAIGETLHPNRWQVALDNGQYGYIGKDPKYVATATDCP